MTRPWAVLSVLCVGNAVSLLDTTVVNVAVPAMIDDLGATVRQVLWVISSYLVAYAVLLVTGGRLGDLFGTRRLYLTGLAVFVAASAACGLAQDPAVLITGRFVQGVGAALLTPQVLALIHHAFPPERRGAALGVWGAVAGLSAAAGPSLGGLVVDTLGWRWVFFINVPIGLAAIGLALLYVPPGARGRRHRFDVLGTVLLSAGLILISYALIEGGPVYLLAVGGVVLLAFVLVERSRQDREPLLPFAVLRDHNFRLVVSTVGVLPFSLNAMFFLTLLYLQTGRGLSASTAGVLTAVPPLLSVVVSVIAGRLIDRFGGKYVLMAGYWSFALGTAGIALAVTPGAPLWQLVPGLAVFGIGMGLAAAPPPAIALRDVPETLTSTASGVFNMARLSGSAIGGAAVGAVLQLRLDGVAVTGGSAAAVSAIRDTYLLPVLASGLAALVTLAVRRPSPTPSPAPAPTR